MQFIRDLWYSKNLSGTKATLIGLIVFLIIILGALVFRVGSYLTQVGKRIDTWCSRKLQRLNKWRT